MQLIEHIEVGSGGAASITFSAIPDTFTDLLLKVSIRGNRTGSNADRLLIKFNGLDTSFTSRRLLGTGSSVASDTTTNVAGQSTEPNSTANTFASNDIYIPNYASASFKSFSVDSVTENNGTEAYQLILAGLWSNTAAVNSITFVGNGGQTFLQYSSASLYGIKSGTDGIVTVS